MIGVLAWSLDVMLACVELIFMSPAHNGDTTKYCAVLYCVVMYCDICGDDQNIKLEHSLPPSVLIAMICTGVSMENSVLTSTLIIQ